MTADEFRNKHMRNKPGNRYEAGEDIREIRAGKVVAPPRSPETPQTATTTNTTDGTRTIRSSTNTSPDNHSFKEYNDHTQSGW